MNYRNVCAGAIACNVLWACSLFIDLSPPVASSDGGKSTVDARDDGRFTPDAAEPKADAEPQDAGDASIGDLRYIFVTLQDFTGDFGSTSPEEALANADNSCKLEADMYIDPGQKVLNGRKWKAWLSNQTTSAISRIDQKSSLTWIRSDGAVIFRSTADITTRLLLAPIAISGSTTVWTGTEAMTGTGAGLLNCGNWLDRGARGTYGVSSSVGRTWSASSSDFNCNAFRSIYCFETRN
jgi:hypothetical protein